MKKIDPRVKLLFIVLLTTLAVLAKDVIYLGIILLVSISINLCLKTELLMAIKRLRHFLGVLLFIAIVQSLTIKGGTVLIPIGNIALLSTKGLQFSLEFILRMSIILLSGLIAASTEGREMIDGLLKLKIPYELAFMTSISLRFIPVFSEEFRSRLNAIAMRGIDIKKLSLPKKVKVYAYLISPTISGCIMRSEELAKSMQVRGFRAYPKRTMLRELKMGVVDYLLVILSLLFSAAFLAGMYMHGVLVAF